MIRFHGGRALALAILLLGACGEKELILSGERFDIREPTERVSATSEATPIRLSSQTNHSEWTHRAGTATHSIQNPSLSAAPAQIWAASIGKGADRKHRITADPVALAGRIFTLDSRSTVTATSNTGVRLWSRDLTPASEDTDDASGGGLAAVGNQVFVTTGFGELVTLNADNGTEIWRQELEAAATGAPTVTGGLVYVVTRSSRAWAIETDTGRVRWSLTGAPSASGVVGGAGPAVSDRLAVFPFGSAGLVATFPKGGLRVWGGSVSGTRLGRAYANVTDVSGDPVIIGDVIYVGNPSGRTVALDATTGERIWTAQEGAISPIWIDGGSLFLVSDQAQLVRLNAKTGERIWDVGLPYIVPKRRKKRLRDIYSHFGPVLAGDRLWVASNDGQLRGFDPLNGSLLATIALPGGGATRPIVVDGVLYVVNQNGQLLAFR